ncbi:hypothetical protein M0805_003232 [Coniferiporia weirii]|nr:hypothetical protein M0805_003232 [Coniferiporia weirii]
MSHSRQASLLQQTKKDRICPACGADFPSLRGRNIHLSRAESCKWYNKGKFLELVSTYVPHGENLEDDPPDATEGNNADPLDWDDGFEMDGGDYAPVSVSHTDHIPGTLYEGLPQPQKRARIDETPTVCDTHPTAGKVVEHVQTTQECSDAHSVDKNSRSANLYEPFTSELDWMVAKWLIQDSSGKSASDRLLKIPRLVNRLGLSFHNMDNLYKKIDKLPGMAPWHETTIRLVDEPDEAHLIQYCDPIEAIKSLWRNPTYAKHMVYAPMKMLSSEDQGLVRVMDTS